MISIQTIPPPASPDHNHKASTPAGTMATIGRTRAMRVAIDRLAGQSRYSAQ
jgi:hypothetical protein